MNMTREEQERLMSCALTVGEKMLMSGAEVSRVEDCIIRICSAYGAERVDVFTIISSIVTSAVFGGKTLTQTRRIKNYSSNFELFDALNALSRKICEKKPDVGEIEKWLKTLDETKPRKYSIPVQCCAWGLVAGAFTLFFGGSLADGLISAGIGAMLRIILIPVEKIRMNRVFANIVLSFFACVAAFLFVQIDCGMSADSIIIGNIMPLIPGIALTNAIRDLISGDIMAGMMRCCEAMLMALAISGGYFLAIWVTGGVI